MDPKGHSVQQGCPIGHSDYLQPHPSCLLLLLHQFHIVDSFVLAGYYFGPIEAVDCLVSDQHLVPE